MNFNLLRHAVAFLLAAPLFLAGCKDNKSGAQPNPPNPADPAPQVEGEKSASQNVAEAEIEEEHPEPPVIRDGYLYSPRPFPDLRVIYGR